MRRFALLGGEFILDEWGPDAVLSRTRKLSAELNAAKREQHAAEQEILFPPATMLTVRQSAEKALASSPSQRAPAALRRATTQRGSSP